MLDVAVIGGGVAGCYCAYRLSVERPGEIALFEASNRIGGRLWSAPLAGHSGQLAEIGGMFFRSHQRNVRGLIEHLALPFEPVAFKRAGQYVRGVSFQDTDFATTVLPFQLNDAERVGSPAALLLHALDQIVPGAAELWPINRASPASAQATFDRLRGARHCDRPLYEYALWNVLSNVLSNEAYVLLSNVLGSVSMLRNVNAFDGVWSLLHEIGDGAGFVLSRGYQSLPLELEARAAQNGARIERARRLTTVAHDGGKFLLSFVDPNGAQYKIHARQVILALPQRPLQRVALSADILGNTSAFEIARDGAVMPMRSCKLFLTYGDAWWDAAAPGEIAARYTDLPMQQCYRWGAQHEGEGLLMAAYADDVSISFWASLAQSGNTFESAAGSDEDARALAAPTSLVQAAERQLGEMHGATLPAARGALFFDWGSEPFGAAWHGWAPHFKSWDIRPLLRRPNPRLDLFICGEAYSQRNGWVEGALNSAELVLEQLGLTRPSWISDPDFRLEVGNRGVEDDDCNTSDVQRSVARHGVAA